MFIVIYDDEDQLCVPMGFDPECAGALESISDSVALFSSRADAKRSIKISKLNAALREAQGLVYNDDFHGAQIKNVKVIPCKEAP